LLLGSQKEGDQQSSFYGDKGLEIAISSSSSQV